MEFQIKIYNPANFELKSEFIFCTQKLKTLYKKLDELYQIYGYKNVKYTRL